MSRLLVSADSHVIEPPEVWDRVDARFRDRAPRIEQGRDGGRFFVAEGVAPRRVTHFFGAGTTEEERRGQADAGFEQDFLAAGWDPHVRLAALDADEVAAEVLYPSLASSLFAIDDLELQAACMRAYNDWLAELCSVDPARLYGAALVPLADVEEALSELERAHELGLTAVMIWSGPPEGVDYPSEAFDPFWSAAQELSMPVTMHLGGTASRLGRATYESHRRAVVGHASIQEVELALIELIFDGVLDRFPELKLVGVETYVGWAPFAMQKLDLTYENTLGQTDYRNARSPSAYFDDRIGLTFITDRVGMKLVEDIGPKQFMWSSDYPHPNSSWPRSQQVVEEELGHLPPDVVDRLTWKTACELYGIAVPAAAAS